MESFKKLMKSDSAMETGGYGYKKQIARVLSGSELPKCNETRDIRDEGIKSEPFCHSANRNVKAETRASKNEYSGTRQDAELHTDTTRPNENSIEGRYDSPFQKSSDKQINMQRKHADYMKQGGKSAKFDKSLNS